MKFNRRKEKMEQFKFSSLKEKKEEKLAVFKSAARMGLRLRKQAAADFKRSLPSA
jgi:hypothetical protein